MKAKFIAYYRVSTQRQGLSGLGLDGQRASVQAFLQGKTLAGEYVEVESGKRANRPMLAQALAACKAQGATLVVAKLDRLARNAHFLTGLLEARVDFLCLDNPTATPMVLTILAAVAQNEAEQNSQRTKAALAQAKRRGAILGSNGRKLAAYNKSTAVAFANSLRERVSPMIANGVSLRGIARELNREGIRTNKGNEWSATTVSRLVSRIQVASYSYN